MAGDSSSDADRPTAPLPRSGCEVIAWIDPPLIVASSAAGETHRVRIGRHVIALDLPTRGPRSLRERARSSFREIPEFADPPLAEPLVEGGWISITSGIRVPRALVVEAIRLRWKSPTLARRVLDDVGASSEFNRELAVWLSTALDWLAAWRGTTRREIGSALTPQMRMAVFGYAGAVGGGEQRTFGVGFAAREGSTQAELRAAFSAASAGRALPLEHQLFAEALGYAEAARYRQAIISACAAAEVALGESVERTLVAAGRDEQERKEVLDRRMAIMDLCRFHAATKRGLPLSMKDVERTLAAPRNRAAHKGRDPDDETVLGALRTARKLVFLTPLPTPASISRDTTEAGPAS